VTRLSFVFDWLIPLGTFLGALSGTAGLGSVSAWAKTQRRSTYYAGPHTGDRNTVSQMIYTGNRINRPALPSISVLLHGGAADWGQYVTLMALFRQAVGNPARR